MSNKATHSQTLKAIVKYNNSLIRCKLNLSPCVNKCPDDGLSHLSTESRGTGPAEEKIALSIWSTVIGKHGQPYFIGDTGKGGTLQTEH